MKRKRHSKSAFQQCRYYEVDNIFEYMVETYINGNFSTFRELYHELNKEARKDSIGFLLVYLVLFFLQYIHLFSAVYL